MHLGASNQRFGLPVGELTRRLGPWLRIIVLVACLPLQICGECRFPLTWAGTWFQSGVQHLIKIQGDTMSFKGKCIDMEGEKYLLEDMLEKCFRCIVIHQRHSNILQYKETYCEMPNTLASLCSKINGDAQLHSMFRVNASPESCPFKGPYTFIYNRGQGECKTPVSSVDSCSEDFRLLLRYQACADITGTESTVEELICLAKWREGSIHYLVGKLEHNMATTDEERYRCFVYEKIKHGSGYLIAQSGDATCHGLFSAQEGSRTMKLQRATNPPSKCQFPAWLWQGHSWHSLDGRRIYKFGEKNNTFRLVDQAGAVPETHVLCLEEIYSIEGKYIMAATYVTVGCTSGYMCIAFTRRGTHVVEVQTGTVTRSPKETCDNHHLDRQTADYTTLVTTSPERKRCPYVGQYVVPGALVRPRMNRDVCDAFSTIKVGCDSGDTIELRYECLTQHHVQAFHCHGNWEENGTSYLITTQKGTKSKYCFIYAEADDVVKFSSVRESCPRNIQPGVGGFMAFNITVSHGQCKPNSGATAAVAKDVSSSFPNCNWLLLLVTVFLSFFSSR